MWFSDASDEWKPGYIEAKDTNPHSYWIINEQNNRTIRRNCVDVKPCHIVAQQQQPRTAAPMDSDPPWIFQGNNKDCAYETHGHQNPQDRTEDIVRPDDEPVSPNISDSTSSNGRSDGHNSPIEQSVKDKETSSEVRPKTYTRSGRCSKLNKDPKLLCTTSDTSSNNWLYQ